MRKTVISKKRTSKKGFVVSVGALVWVMGALVALFIVYYMIFKLSALTTAEKIKGSSDIFASNIYSSAYLKSPVEVNGNTLSMSDLIRLADENIKYYLVFVKETNTFWNKVMPSDICFYVKIKSKKLVHSVQQSSCSYSTTDFGMRAWVGNSKIPLKRFRTLIPSHRKGEFIEIYTYYDITGLKKAYGELSPYLEYEHFISPISANIKTAYYTLKAP